MTQFASCGSYTDILAWLDRVDEIVRRGKEAYLGDDLLQEAGDSLMMLKADGLLRSDTVAEIHRRLAASLPPA